MSPSPTLVLIPTDLEARRLTDCGGLGTDDGVDERRVELCGFGPVAAAARTAQLLATVRPGRVVLVGIAGTFAPDRCPVGSAHAFTRVHLSGVGVGEGADFQGPPALGFPQWPGGPGGPGGPGDGADQAPIEEELALWSPPGTAPAELLTTCAASASPEHAAARHARHPDCVAEDMEGFGVALACALAGVPLGIVRGISNRVGERDPKTWRIPAALAAARRTALELLATS